MVNNYKMKLKEYLEKNISKEDLELYRKIQRYELLKYITDSCEVRYYREYVDTYIKDIMYNHYIKTLTEYLNNNEG